MANIVVTGSSLTTDQKFDIDAFRANVQKNAYHRASHFNMILNVPEGLRGSFTTMGTNSDGSLKSSNTNFMDSVVNLVFSIEATELPGIALATDEIRRYGIGNFERKPYVPTFSELTAVVRSDESGDAYRFFQSWLKLIVNFDTKGGVINEATGFNGATMHEVAYKSNYAIDAKVITYDEGGDENMVVQFTNLYPIFLSPTSLDWTDNRIVKFQVKFTYSEWFLQNRTTKIKPNLPR